jgi:hypothetical protein
MEYAVGEKNFVVRLSCSQSPQYLTPAALDVLTAVFLVISYAPVPYT